MTPEEILNDASLNETSYGPNSHLDRVFNLDKSPSRLEEIITPHKFSSSTTFLEETISDIRRSGHEPSDIILIEAKSVNLVHTWTDFIKNANFKYKRDSKVPIVTHDLTIMFADGIEMKRTIKDKVEQWTYPMPDASVCEDKTV